MTDERPKRSQSPDQRTAHHIERDVDRKLKSRAEGRRAVWFGLGMFGLVGWSVAIPTVLGLALGLWLDARYPSHASWTLTFLIIGVAVGCFNAWHWVKQESSRR